MTAAETHALPMCPSDPTSFANTHECRVTHLDLHLTADFAAKTLAGHATLTVDLVNGCGRIVLDSSYVDIHSVHLIPNSADVAPLPLVYTVHPRHAKFGEPIEIVLPEPAADDETTVKVKIAYTTTAKCTAGQWLTPEQTVGKKHPYFFTQCQAIHARSLVPIQDTPQLKITYSASLTVPAPLRALMSARRTGDSTSADGLTRTFHFDQPTTIPSYLLAIAIGNIEGIDVGPRTTVFSEPEVVEKAAEEFRDTEKIIQAGEELIYTYEWGRYDLLVLPSSFPYGGMENPNLTFVTPTLLAGDKSLVDVIVHEFAHSYAGNLVTTKNWGHFWLNEGWCVFVERKIIAKLHGEPQRQFDARIGEKALKESVDLFGADHPYTCLCLNLTGEDPDDSFSSVPYEKGFAFLYHLEHVLGDETFAAFTRAYFKQFAGQSIDTNDFKGFLFQFVEHYFGDEKYEALKKVNWEQWLHAPGMPPVKNEYDDSLAKPCLDLAARWEASRDAEDTLASFKPEDVAELNALQMVMFLELLQLKANLPHAHLARMDEVYKLTAARNCEIRFRWHSIALAASYKSIYTESASFLSEVGRMKYVRPLFRLLNKAEGGRDLAVATFTKLRDGYHPICSNLVAKDLGL
ncbi:leukotriene A-4 hydrolase-like protein [Blastocladiella britannica]|nr:leukotriene A-4 hydrolase-like protein [Blastocladiella britannica]